MSLFLSVGISSSWADEAHRSQYGLTEKVVVRQKEDGEVEAKTIIGTARIIRDSLSERYIHWLHRHSHLF